MSWNNYSADVLPNNASPAWTATHESGSVLTEAIESGTYHLKTAPSSSKDWYILDSYLSNSTGSTLESRFKLVSDNGQTYAVYISLNDNLQYADCYIQNGTPVLTDGSTTISAPGVNVTQFHTYRLTLQGNTKKLYIDGVLKATITTSGLSEPPQIQFGMDDSTLGNGNSNEAYWDYVNYSINGAFAGSTIDDISSKPTNRLVYNAIPTNIQVFDAKPKDNVSGRVDFVALDLVQGQSLGPSMFWLYITYPTYTLNRI